MNLKKLLALVLVATMLLSTLSLSVLADEPNGSITPGYMDAVSVWGEGGGNATESLVVELYAGKTKLAMTSLNDVDDIIDGNVENVTWHIYTDGRDGDLDPYWHTEWYVEPTSNVIPDKVAMVIDGVQVAENEVQMNAPDDLGKTDWEELDGVEYVAPVHVVMTDGTVKEYTSLLQAMDEYQFLTAVEKIVVNQDITEDMSTLNEEYVTFNGVIESGHPNGVTITNTEEDWHYMTDLTISEDVHFITNAPFFDGGDNYIFGTLEVGGNDACYYQGYDAVVTVKDGGKVDVDGTVINRYHKNADSGIYIEGDGDDSTVEFKCSYYIGTYSGVFSAVDANVETGYVLFKNSYDADKNDGYADAEMTLDNSSITVIGTSDGQNSFQIDANTTLTMTNGSAIEDVRDFNILAGANLDLSVDASSSISATNVSVADDVKMDATQNSDGTITFTKSFDGEGTEESPYLINNIDDLKAFRDNVNSGISYKGQYIKLMNDIDLDQEEWIPIGNKTKKFEGYFDGNNKTISNILVSGNNDYAGFFGYIKGNGMTQNSVPTVQNLTLDNVSVSGDYFVGGLTGQGYTCKVANVTVKGNVNGTRYVGGLIGHVYTYLDNCHFVGNVTGTFDAIGGIAGAGDGRIYNSSVIGDVTGDNWVGGIIANGQEGTSVVGCYVKGTVSTSSNWYFGIGGIAGVGGHGYNGSVIKDNYFDGEVYLCGEKVNAIVVGFINATSNDTIGTAVEGNSWNTEYYPAKTPVVVTADTDENTSPEDWAASASKEKSSVRNNNLVMLESDLQYIDAESADDVAIMSFSDVTEEAVATAVVENKYKAYIDTNKNGLFDEGEVKYTELQAAFDAAAAGDRIDLMGKTITLKGGNHLKISKDITMENGVIDITDTVWTANSVFYVTGGTAQDFVTLTLNNVDFTGDNYSSAYGVIYVENNGGAVINNCDFNLSNEKDGSGGVLKGNGIEQSAFEVKNSTFTLENPSRVITSATVALEGVTIDAKVTDNTLVPGDTNNHAFRNVVGTISGSTITADGFETGIKNTSGSLSISDNSVVTLKNSKVTDLIVGAESALEIDYTSTVSADTKDIAEGSIDGAVNPVVVVGEKAFSTLDEALDYALDNNIKTVNITVLDDIAFSGKFANFDKITFTGTNREQTIDLNINSSFDANVALEFNNLTVSRLDSNWLYHYFYIKGGLAFNNCKMIGLFNVTKQDTSFTNCDFYNDDTFGDGSYSLWLYNCDDGVEVNVTDCTFDVYERAIKMYGDGFNENMVLNISGTEFTSRTADKTVVEMAYDNSTGVGAMSLNIANSSATGFGAPEHLGGAENAWFNVEGSNTLSTVKVNGKVVYSDFAVMVGDKFYTTLQEAFDKAEDGDTITLLDDIEFTQKNALVNGTWLDGVKYTGDKSFTVDLNGYTISDNGDLNDYLLYFNNQGSKENTVTLKNGTISGGPNLWAAICVGASSAVNATTVNLGEGLVVTGEGTGRAGSENTLIKNRYNSVVNILDGATIDIGSNVMYGISTGGYTDVKPQVNVYDGAVITSDNSKGIAVTGNGIINIEGGTITSEGWAVYTSTSGQAEVTISGGNITGATGAVASAADLSSYPTAAPVVKISGGNINGQIASLVWGTSTESNGAELTVSGGTFDQDPSAYVAEGYSAIKSDSFEIWEVSVSRQIVLVPSITENSEGELVVKTSEIFTVDVKTTGIDAGGVRWTLNYDKDKFDLVGIDTHNLNVVKQTADNLTIDIADTVNADSIVATYTFKALNESVSDSPFTLTKTELKTNDEAWKEINVTSITTAVNTDITIELRKIDYSVLFDGIDTTATGCELAYDGKEHTFRINVTEPDGATISYKVTNEETKVSYEETNEVKITGQGVWTIEYKVTKEGYEPVSDTYTLTITEPDFVVEVNMEEAGDYVGGYKLVLVYTNAEKVTFDYDSVQMLDVSDSEYKYNNTDEYNFVYALVVESIDTTDIENYKNLVTVDYKDTATKVDYEYAHDINFSKTVNFNDIVAAYSVLEKDANTFANYMAGVIKADVDFNRTANTLDMTPIISEVYAE